MKLGPKALLPAAVLVGSLVVSAALVVARPVPEAQEAAEHRPMVAVVAAAPSVLRMLVRAQGTVEPRTENELVAEVGGRLVWVSPALESGSFFAAGEVLARIEAADYEIAVERARAALERARSQRKLGQASLARSRALREAGAASEAAYDQVESSAAIAAANQREAEAALRQAELELARTELRVPFAGRVRERRIDVGQLVARGAPLASVFAVDFIEVRLPIPSEELAYLELPAAAAPWKPGGRAHPRVLRGPRAHLARPHRTCRGHTRRAHAPRPRRRAHRGPLWPREGSRSRDGSVRRGRDRGARGRRRGVGLPRGALRGSAEVVVVDADRSCARAPSRCCAWTARRSTSAPASWPANASSRACRAASSRACPSRRREPTP